MDETKSQEIEVTIKLSGVRASREANVKAALGNYWSFGDWVFCRPDTSLDTSVSDVMTFVSFQKAGRGTLGRDDTPSKLVSRLYEMAVRANGAPCEASFSIRHVTLGPAYSLEVSKLSL